MYYKLKVKSLSTAAPLSHLSNFDSNPDTRRRSRMQVQSDSQVSLIFSSKSWCGTARYLVVAFLRGPSETPPHHQPMKTYVGLGLYRMYEGATRRTMEKTEQQQQQHLTVKLWDIKRNIIWHFKYPPRPSADGGLRPSKKHDTDCVSCVGKR